ncbi:MAG TPA: DNA transformation protein [Pasteurellaceae bacterium]|nr:DNA transformation protein [Pasteurellaceae bacterium]
MSITEKNTLKIRTVLNNLIGNVTAKTLFTGYGLYYKSNMFGVYQSDIFYLRAKNHLAEYLENKGAVRWVSSDHRSRLMISSYYQLPLAITQNPLLYQKVIIESIQQIQDEKLSENLKKINRIKGLPNLTIKYERLLSKVNITNVQELKTIGAVNSYVRLKKNGFLVNINFFWNLFAALQNRSANMLTDNEKSAALKILNVALANAGLRQIKTNNPEK